jgi:hypothetical protein
VEKRIILRVSKDGFNGYFGGYSYDGDISYAHSPLKAMEFLATNTMPEFELLSKAMDYLYKNGFYYEEMILEYQIYKA